MANDLETIDFFMDESLVEDPYPYFEQLRAACPVVALPHLGVVAVTGYDEACEVYTDVDRFSSCNSVIGPFATFPVPLEGDDIGGIIERYRDQLPMHEHMVTMDPPDHTRERALLMRLITPKRLKDNEAFMWRLADQQLDDVPRRRPRASSSARTPSPSPCSSSPTCSACPRRTTNASARASVSAPTPARSAPAPSTRPSSTRSGWLDDWFATVHRGPAARAA